MAQTSKPNLLIISTRELTHLATTASLHLSGRFEAIHNAHTLEEAQRSLSPTGKFVFVYDAGNPVEGILDVNRFPGLPTALRNGSRMVPLGNPWQVLKVRFYGLMQGISKQINPLKSGENIILRLGDELRVMGQKGFERNLRGLGVIADKSSHYCFPPERSRQRV